MYAREGRHYKAIDPSVRQCVRQCESDRFSGSDNRRYDNVRQMR